MATPMGAIMGRHNAMLNLWEVLSHSILVPKMQCKQLSKNKPTTMATFVGVTMGRHNAV